MCLMCPGQGELSEGYSLQAPTSQSPQTYSIQAARIEQESGNYSQGFEYR